MQKHDADSFHNRTLNVTQAGPLSQSCSGALSKHPICKSRSVQRTPGHFLTPVELDELHHVTFTLGRLQKEHDGTDKWLGEQSDVLRDVLDVLCGVTAERDSDDTVRQSLADAVYLMVRAKPQR